jgi:RNA-directed DNA polymerase
VDELKAAGKPVDSSKWEVGEAYRQVKANQGAPGVDRCSIEDFEADLRGNRYKLWSRSVSWEAGMDLPVGVRPG